MHNVTNYLGRKDWQVENTNDKGCVPLLAGVAVAGKPITNPDGARTIPGWPMPTGPSRPMISLSLVLRA